MKIYYNNIEISGEQIKPEYRDCLHLDVETFSSNKIMKDENRIWLKLDKDTNELGISGYPYSIASFNKNLITI